MEFADLDDDLFSENVVQKKIDFSYKAKFCESGWFFDKHKTANPEQAQNTKMYQADYMYVRGDWKLAAILYEEALQIIHPCNTVVCRECWEGLARCYARSNVGCLTKKYCQLMRESSKNCDQISVSLSLCLEVNFECKNWKGALSDAQSIISLHPFSSDFWFKLACIYAGLNSISLPSQKLTTSPYIPADMLHGKVTDQTDNSPGEVKKCGVCNTFCCAYDNNSTSDNDHFISVGDYSNKIIGICLLKSDQILQSVQATCSDYALQVNLKNQDKIYYDLSVLNLEDSFVEKAKCQVRTEVMWMKNVDSDKFVDIGSSKICASTEVVATDPWSTFITGAEFELKWFGMIL